MQHSSVWLRRLSARDTLSGAPGSSVAAINTTTLPDGAIVWVADKLSDYQLQRLGGLVVDGDKVIAAAPVGQWVSLRTKTRVMFGSIRPSLASAPVPIEAGPTLGYLMANTNMVYCELPFDSMIDRSRNLVLGIGWAPSASENNKTVTWRFDVGLMKAGKSLLIIDVTADALNTAVPATVAEYAHTGIVLTPAQWATDPAFDEIHLRITRIATGADPVNPPGIHHIVFVQPLL